MAGFNEIDNTQSMVEILDYISKTTPGRIKFEVASVRNGGRWYMKRDANDATVRLYISYSPVGFQNPANGEEIWPVICAGNAVRVLVQLLENVYGARVLDRK